MPAGSNNENQTIIIVVATLAGLNAVSLILVGFFFRKRKCNQRAEKQNGNLLACYNKTIYCLLLRCGPLEKPDYRLLY